MDVIFPLFICGLIGYEFWNRRPKYFKLNQPMSTNYQPNALVSKYDLVEWIGPVNKYLDIIPGDTLLVLNLSKDGEQCLLECAQDVSTWAPIDHVRLRASAIRQIGSA